MADRRRAESAVMFDRTTRGPISDASSDRRVEQRFETGHLTSSLGDVLDLSGSGVRVRCKGRPTLALGQSVEISLQGAEQRLRLSARVVRVRRTGLWSHQVGLQFCDLRPGMNAALASFAKYGFIHTGGAPVRSQEPAQGPGALAPIAGRTPIKVLLEIPDPYRALGIPPTASAEEVRAAYSRLARECHPDVAPGNPEAAERFSRLNGAYELLANPDERRRYDAAAAQRQGLRAA